MDKYRLAYQQDPPIPHTKSKNKYKHTRAQTLNDYCRKKVSPIHSMRARLHLGQASG